MVEGVKPIDVRQFFDLFKNLEHDGSFDITSYPSDVYNCIAFAMGFEDRWVDFNTDEEGHWWPPIPEKDFRPSSLIAAFEYMGFERCNDGVFEDGFDKVALYKVDEQSDPWIPEHWTHAARIIGSGVCHSKIGRWYDIHHRDGDVFQGSIYGNIYQYMKRPVSLRNIVEQFSSGDDCDFEIKY